MRRQSDPLKAFSEITDSLRREAHGKPKRSVIDPKLASTKGLMALWTSLYLSRRVQDQHPHSIRADQRYDAKWRAWQWAIYRLQEEGHTYRKIERVMHRALAELQYPYDWPSATVAMFNRLADPNYRARPFGLRDFADTQEYRDLMEYSDPANFLARAQAMALQVGAMRDGDEDIERILFGG
jgi:hypothetical protein